MKLLLFSDVHVNKTHCRHLVEMSKEVDLVIGAGDFGSLRMGIKKRLNG
jgi:predicted phosphodiesterase